MIKFIGAGLLAVDHIFLASDTKKNPKNFEYLGSSGGGTVSNILSMLSLLGHENYIFGLTGNYLGEKIIKDDLHLFNINHDAVIKRGDKNDIRTTRQFSHKILLNGKHYFKNICLDCGFKFSRDYQMSINDINKKVIEISTNKNLIIDRSNKATLRLADIAKNNNNKIIYNFDFNIYGRYQMNSNIMLSYSDIVKTNKKVYDKFIGGSKERLIEKWVNKYPYTKYLFITNKDKGVYGFTTLYNEKKYFECPSYSVDKLKDSSGAGDIFLAIMTSELCKNNKPENIDDFKHLVNIAQALAALNCTLYGARALQRFFLKQKFKYKEIIAMAEEIIDIKKVANPFSPTIGLPGMIEKPYRLTKINGCNVCGSLSKEKKIKITSKQRRKKSISIHNNIIQAPWTMISSYLIGKSNRDLIYKDKYNNYIFIGSGGSFSAAIFAETLLFNTLSLISKSLTPFEIEGLDIINKDTGLFYISHGGNNTDILGSALWAAEKLKHENGIILTGNKNSKLVEIANDYKWKKIYIQSKERNFVSVVGYLSQIAALCGIFASENTLKKLDTFFSENNLRILFNYFSRKMERLAFDIANNEQIIQNIHLIGLARGWGWPSLMDLESKIVEGGICTIETSELKNYTHGRYINTFGAYDRKNRRVLMMCTPKDEEIVNYLTKKFSKYIKYYVVKSDKDGIIGSLELIIQNIFLAWYLGQISKKNILKPKFPREARGLYSWEPSWRKNNWKT